MTYNVGVNLLGKAAFLIQLQAGPIPSLIQGKQNNQIAQQSFPELLF